MNRRNRKVRPSTWRATLWRGLHVALRLLGGAVVLGLWLAPLLLIPTGG